MRNDRKLTFIILILAAILTLETGYIIGKNNADKKQEETVKPKTETSKPKGLVSPGMGIMAGTQPLMRGDMEMWDPYAEMQKMQRAMNRMFNESYHNAKLHGESGVANGVMTFDPAIDVRENDKEYLVTIDLPGVNKDTIKINANSNSITIEGERSVESEQKGPDGSVHVSERGYGSFLRTIPFAQKIKPGDIKAETSEGVAMIRVPKEIDDTKQSEDNVQVTIK